MILIIKLKLQMTINLEWKLRAINIACQSFFTTFSILALYLTLSKTLPSYCQSEYATLFQLKLVLWFLFCNMCVNYICMRHKSYQSILPCERKVQRNQHGSYPLHDNGFPTVLLNENAEDEQIKSCIHNSITNLTDQQLDSPNNNNYKSIFSYTYENEIGTSNELDSQHTIINFQSDFIMKRLKLEIKNIKDWHFCRDCGMMAPPRSKHCPLCKACILKRDHHCFFAGCCVGFHNQRYFTIFCLHAGVASFYVWTFMSYYLSEHYEPLQTWGYLSYLPPLVLYFWMFGIISLSSLGLVIFQYFICVAGLSCFYFFIIQMYLIVCGQTRYECVKGIHVYKGTVRKNILSVFGPLWVIGFFVPVPFLGYYGDGKNWHEWQRKV